MRNKTTLRLFGRAAFLLLFLPLSVNGDQADARVEIGPGLIAVIHEPPAAPIGLVIVAPGGGYDMDQPLMTRVAAEAAAEGYRALRFNWRNYTAGIERKPDRQAEIRDLREAVAYLRESTRGVDHVVLIGKSLGSIVASTVAGEIRRPVILLTPICRSADEFRQFYPARVAEVVMITGDGDPLCRSDVLFNAADPRTRIAIVKGDHSFSGESDADSERNLVAVVDIVGYWLASWRR